MQRAWPWFLLFLLLPLASRAAPSGVFVSEIAWAGSSASTADEWLELANGGTEPVDVSGWSVEGAGSSPLVLPAGSLIAPQGTFLIANYSADETRSTLYAAPDWVTTAVALSNSAMRLTLREASGVQVDLAGDGSAPFAGASGATKASMERRVPRQDGSVAAAWISAGGSVGFDAGAAELGSPGSFIFAVAPAEESAGEETSGASTTPETAPEQAAPGATSAPATAARLCELFPSPPSGQEEWIELCNPSSVGELLHGWTVEDGSGASTPLSGLLLPYGRHLVRSPKGKLNNAGDLVILKHPSGRTIDAVAYGTWEEGPYRRGEGPGAGEALMREELGDAWHVTIAPTPEAPNVRMDREASESPAPTPPTHVPAAATSSPAPKAPALTVMPTETVAPPVTRAETVAAPASANATSAIKPAAKAKTPTKSKTTAKTTPLSRYKGEIFSGVIAVPPGVHAKSRAFVLVGEDLREVRFSNAPPKGWTSGRKLTFVAQRKTDESGEHLLANPNSVRLQGTVALETRAAESWPDRPERIVLRGTVETQEARTIRIAAGGVTGIAHLTAAPATALKAGDEVEIRGVAAPGSPPTLYADSATSLRLVASFHTEAPRVPGPRFPSYATWSLVALAVGVGAFAYLRREKMRRLALAGVTSLETLDE